MANVKGTVGTSAEERRYSAIGICLNKILASGLRKAIAEEFQDWYNILTQPPTEIDKQVFGSQIRTLPPSTVSLQYKNINGNNVPRSPRAYDYAVKDPLSLAMLFLHPSMAKFTGFDETMDLSAVLTVMIEADPFVKCGAAVLAKRVRSNVRNEWVHSKFSMWTNDRFNQAMEEMQSLVKSTNLSDADKKEICDELQLWRDKESNKLWKWKTVSIAHKEKFEKLIEHGQERPDKIMEINGVRVCLKKDFLIAKGGQSEGVYIGLGTDGSEKAVKLFLKDTHGHLAEEEKNLLITCETKQLFDTHVVRYWFLDDKSDNTFAFLIMELCEETLENFVARNSLEDLIEAAPGIIQQILKGLADLHREPDRILHRDLKPSNILRNSNGKWLLGAFGIGRILSNDETTLVRVERGTNMWKVIESYCESGAFDKGNACYKTKSDIQMAGMVAFYILTKGQHLFGEDEQVRTNLLAENPVNLKMLDGHLFAKDLISWMLSHDPKDRPSAEEALQHPYLRSKEQQFKLLWEMRDYIKGKDKNSRVVKELNENEADWRSRIENDVFKYLISDQLKKISFKYSSSWTDCLRLILNIKQHWKDYPRTEPEAIKVGDPQEYFLGLFPDLVLAVYKIARSCDDLKKQPGPDLKESRESHEKMNADKKDAIIDVPDYSFPVTEINGEAADMISVTIGLKGGCYGLPFASAILLFPPQVVQEEVSLTFSRIRHEECEEKPKDGEAFVSRILKIEPEGVKFRTPVTVLLSHSACERQDIACYYELVVGNLSQAGRQELETERISSIEDVPKQISNKEILGDYLPLAQASILETCTVVAVTRARSDQISVLPDRPLTFTKQYGDSAELMMTFPFGATEEIQDLTVQLLPSEFVLKSEVPFQKNIVCGSVIKVSGQTNPFLKPINVALTYSNPKCADIAEEFLPVGKKSTFTTKYGLLVHSQKEFESKTSLEALNENGDQVFIERLRKDQVKFSFSVNHFCRLLPILKPSDDASLPPCSEILRFLVNDNQPPCDAIVLSVHNIGSNPKTLHAVLAPTQEKVNFKFEVTNFMEPLKPREEIYFCVPMSDIDHFKLEDNTLWFNPDDVSKVQSNTDDGTELNGKYMRYLKDEPCNNGENHHMTRQGNCRAKAPIHISQDGSLKNIECGIRRRKASHKSWKWTPVSKTHKETIETLIEHGRHSPGEIMVINGVRVCVREDFRIGKKGGQSDGVYVALGTDGSEKAVKLFLKATHDHLTEKEKKLLTTCNAKDLTHVVSYWFLDDESHNEFSFLFIELCEETLETFVDGNSVDHLLKHTPGIIRQILKGLAGLHRKPKRILHRDLKPSNILRNVHDEWLLADFGIGRILLDDESMLETKQAGTKMWMPVESYGETDDDKVPYTAKSDIQVAGMVAFYILTKGKHPFGEDEQVRVNLLAGNPVNLKMLDGHPFAKDLISWMLSHDPKDRPSAEEALQHPYLKSKEQQFKLLWGMWDYIKDKGERSDVVKELNKDTSDWRKQMGSDVYDYLRYDYIREESLGYNRSWKHCIRLIRNVKEHWKDYPKTHEKIKVGDYQKFFLNLFSDLVLRVFKIARSCDDLKELL